MFLLSSAAGTGKTFILGGLIHEIQTADPKQGIVYVTTSQPLIEQVRADLKPFGGINRVEFVTYSWLSTNPGKIRGEGKVVIFDEAHNIKSEDTQRGTEGQRLIKGAKFRVFSSATPYENPVEIGYLADTGIFDEINGYPVWAQVFGATVERRVEKTKDEYGRVRKREYLAPYWNSTPEAAEAAKEGREWLRKRGVMIQRSARLDPELVSVEFKPVDLAAEHRRLQDQVSQVYGAAQTMRGVDGDLDGLAV